MKAKTSHFSAAVEALSLPRAIVNWSALGPSARISLDGQKNTRKCPTFRMKPKIVDALLKEDIVDISCGDEHATALSEAGAVFVWGRNENGQLGTGDTKDGALNRNIHT